ncbi:TauD/TfdA family dioxygenase, partial [Emcibacteraceae bacterium]|nr:TauD/TfdA family dioxygenase [Emcibacteraceae bacterium]
MNLFDQLANDPKLHLQMELKPGDLQFVYNHSQLHDREGFEDHPELENRRYLYRLWISPKGDRELPECFKERFGSIEIGNRGGIITENTKLTFELG